MNVDVKKRPPAGTGGGTRPVEILVDETGEGGYGNHCITTVHPRQVWRSVATALDMTMPNFTSYYGLHESAVSLSGKRLIVSPGSPAAAAWLSRLLVARTRPVQRALALAGCPDLEVEIG